jgi:hypothetical protein
LCRERRFFWKNLQHPTKNFPEKSSRLLEKSSGRFFSADDPNVTTVTDDQKLLACFNKVETTPPHFKFKPGSADLPVHIQLVPAYHASLCRGFGGKDLVKPDVVAMNGAKIAHAATFARFRLTGD